MPGWRRCNSTPIDAALMLRLMPFRQAATSGSTPPAKAGGLVREVEK
jgi:hypothetical protein